MEVECMQGSNFYFLKKIINGEKSSQKKAIFGKQMTD
jgi:hypothetical protein